MEYRPLRVIISGGGTGGHIFPAISIAGKLKELNPDTEILFVGAEGKMEMEKVPAAGYKITGLPVVGLQRQFNWQNIKNNLQIPFKILKSLRLAGNIIKDFRPDIVIGVGGYASAPLLWKATSMHCPTLIQEQNGFAGLTNKILGKRVGRICVAYEGMEKFFPAGKIVFTGNPIRSEISPRTDKLFAEGIKYYSLRSDCRHLLVLGGSLGSGTLNNAMRHWIEGGLQGGEDVEVMWQCGRYYKSGIDKFMREAREIGLPVGKIHHSEFIGRMDLAYAVADVIISRSGASSVSEICAARKAAIFVPSPNVAEDHQTHNAMALVNRNAAVLVRDEEARERLLPEAMALVHDEVRIRKIEEEAGKLARTQAASDIAKEVYKLLEK